MTRLRIVLAATIGSAPRHGGWTWVVLQYALGLRRLGHDVLLVDPIDRARLPQPEGRLSGSGNETYFTGVTCRFGFPAAAFVQRAGDDDRDSTRTETIGLTLPEIVARVAQADLLINVSGALRDERVLMAARRRLYLDLDPAFTQLWHEVEGIDMGLDRHTHWATIGLAIGSPSCHVPTCGRRWITTPQPIVLDAWPVSDAGPVRGFTTVANWRGYGSIEHGGVHYGQKAHAFRALMALPSLTGEPFELALGIHPDETSDLRRLRDNGWRLVDPTTVAATPERYQAYVRESRAEIAVAKTGYVAARCGWFSDRSLCYLASGRPVVAEDTGLTGYLPTDAGIVAFDSLETARDAVTRVGLDYRKHARAARAIAAEYFDSDKVLPRLIENVGGAS